MLLVDKSWKRIILHIVFSSVDRIERNLAHIRLCYTVFDSTYISPPQTFIITVWRTTSYAE